MARTKTEIQTLALDILIDAGIDPEGAANQVFATAELTALVPGCLSELSKYRPWEVLYSFTTSGTDAWEIGLPGEMLKYLLRLKAVEYDWGDDDPTLYRRNFDVIGGRVLRLNMESKTQTGKSLRFHTQNRQLLVDVGTTDLLGAVQADAFVGDTTLVLKSLGTGTIAEDTILTFSGDAQMYRVTGTATIAANEAAVSIYPGLELDTGVNTVVTLIPSTLDVECEEVLSDLLAARAAMNTARKYIGSINVGSGRSAQEMLAWGQNKYADVLRRLKRTTTFERVMEYPTT